MSFPTHEKAKAALEKLNDGKSLNAAIAAFIARQTDAGATKLVKTITGMLFTSSHGQSTLVRASWATPRGNNSGSRSRYDDHDDWDDREYVDDCPDGIDKQSWDNYCEGRD